MPTHSNRDIYRTRPHRKSVLDDKRETLQNEMEWFRRARRMQLSTVAFVLLLLIFLAFLVAVIAYQRHQIREARAQPRAPTLAFSSREVVWDDARSDLDPEVSLALDEWLARGPEPVGDGPHPFTPHWIQEAALHLRRAEGAYEAGQWRVALDHYETAARIIPNIEGLSVQRGLSHLRLREFSEAEALFIDEQNRGMQTSGLLNNLAVAQMGQEGREADAEQSLRAAIERDPDYLPARHNLALLYYRIGRLESAAEAFSEVYLRRPLSPEHIHLYAHTLLQLERWEQAAAVLRDSIRMYPEAPPIRFRLAEALAHLSDPSAAVEELRAAVALVDARHAMRWINRSGYDPLRRQPEFEQLVTELAGAMP